MGGAGKGDYGIPVPARPDQGHLLNRFSAGAGIRDNDSFVEMKLRPAYHGLMDDDRGHVEGSQILFTELGFRYYVECQRPTPQNVDLIDIVSISPRDDFFTPLSWKVRTGLRQRLGEDGADHLLYGLASGAGLAWKIPFAGLVYAMVEAEGDLGGRSEERWALGAGGSAGVLRAIGEQWKLHLFGRDVYHVLGDSHNDLELSLQAHFACGTNGSLSAGVTWRKVYSARDTEATLAWNLFFRQPPSRSLPYRFPPLRGRAGPVLLCPVRPCASPHR